MSGRLAHGWSMARASFGVLRRYPKLAWLPMISGAVLALVVGSIALSLWPQLRSTGSMSASGILGIFALYFLLTIVVVFCNVALIHCALRCHAGEEPSIRDGLEAAAARLPQILGWALLSATIGIALNALENALKENLGFFGTLISGLFGFAWSVVTYFVVPVLASEGLGPLSAIRRSSDILRGKWGESLAGEARFALLGILCFVSALGLFLVGLAIAVTQGAGALAGLGLLLMAAGVACGLATIVVWQALSAIFQAGIYVYACTGVVPPSFDRAMMEGAFRHKP
jgi:hypothetical protein